MGNPLLWTFSIGGVPLTRFEVPETFEVGHEVKEAVHQYISETGTPVIVVQSQGAFPVPTKWAGKLFGASAISRYQQLDALAVAEQPVTFVYGPLSFNVHIKAFKFTIHYQLEIDYEIELTVISDQNGAVPPISTGQSFNTGTQSFYDTSTAAMASINDPLLPASVIAANKNLTSAFQLAIPLNAATLAQIQNIVNCINDVTAALTPYVEELQANARIAQDLANLNASLIALQGFGLLNRNLLQLLGQNITSATIILLGTTSNLFAVASQYYPNSDPAAAADLIAKANNLTDYFVTTPTNITLPPVFS